MGSADEGTGSATDYEPVTASNRGEATTFLYEARRDAFSDNVRTDVRMLGSTETLLLTAVCFDSGTALVGLELANFARPERDAGVPDELEVIWRLGDGPVQRETLTVEFLGDTPALAFRSANPGFQADWPQVLGGGSLVVRISYRGVQEDVFDLDAFAETPVHQNLVNCGSY